MRKTSNSPLILILFVLPNNSQAWVRGSDTELIAQKCAYWYYPDSNFETPNAVTQRIEISKDQRLSGEVLDELFDNYS